MRVSSVYRSLVSYDRGKSQHVVQEWTPNVRLGEHDSPHFCEALCVCFCDARPHPNPHVPLTRRKSQATSHKLPVES